MQKHELILGKGKSAVIDNGTIKLHDERLILEDGKAVVSLTIQDIRKLSRLASENL